MMDQIPNELIHIIITYLTFNDINKMKQLSNKINKMVDDELLIDKYYNERITSKDKFIYDRDSFVKLVGKNINNLLFFQSICINDIHKVDYPYKIAAFCGNNELILLLKNEFPNIKYTSEAFIIAANFCHKDTLLLLKKEFSPISELDLYHAFFATNNKDIKLLLKNEFIDCEGSIKIGSGDLIDDMNIFMEMFNIIIKKLMQLQY